MYCIVGIEGLVYFIVELVLYFMKWMCDIDGNCSRFFIV